MKKTDLHKAKKSHMSVPIVKDVEFHFNSKDIGKKKIEKGKAYNIRVPMVNTSLDKGAARFKQTGKMTIEKAIKDVLKRNNITGEGK